MALMDGKQIKDTSISLNKINQSGVVSFNSATMSFNTGSKLQVDYEISSPSDVVNKNYVDAVASGLDAKTPVRVVAATGSISLSGSGYPIDGFTISNGDRVLVASQGGTNVATASNGIYVVSSGSWSRSTDFDGNPITEVSHGNFVFVTDGSVYEHTGWVLTGTDATNPDQILVGTNSQLWVQFSEQANIRAGSGLTFDGQVLNVGAGTGITVSADAVSIANTTVVANSYGQANSVTTFTVNSQGQLTSAGTTSIAINAAQVTDFNSASETAIFTDANFTDGITVTFSVTTGSSVTAEVTLGSLTASRLNIINPASASQDWKLGYNSNGQFEWFDPSQSDISEVIAGDGLSGGGSSGSVTLNVNTSNGLTVISDSVQVADTIAGSGLTFSAGVINVNTANGLTINNDNVQVADTIAGSGLTFSAGVINVNTSNGLVVNNDNVQVADTIAGSGLTFSSGVIDVKVSSDSIEIVNDEVRLKNTITGSRTFQDSVTIGGNLIVSGTVSYINTIDLYVKDNIITLNGTYSGPPMSLSGIEVNVGNGTYSKLLYQESTGLWLAGLSGSEISIITQAGTGLTKSGNTISIDTAGFSSALAGNGLTSSAGTLNVNVANGLTINNDNVEVASTIAGSGLTFSAGVINVNTSNGLVVNNDNVEVASTIAGSGLTFSAGVINVNAANGLTINNDNVSLGGTLNQNTLINVDSYDLTIGNFDYLALTGSVFDINLTDTGMFILDAGDSGTIDIYGGDLTIYVTGSVDITSTGELTLTFTNSIVTDISGASQGLVYNSDYSAGFISNSLVSKKYVDDAVSIINSDFITGVTAGAGISGGGSSGFVTLNVETTVNKGLTFSSSGDSGTLEVLLKQNGGLTFSDGGVIPDVDNTTISINSSGKLTVTGGATTPKYTQRNLTPTSGFTEGLNGQSTGLTISVVPSQYSYINIFVNGVLQFLGDGASSSGVDCYFSNDGGATPRSVNSISSGDVLYWNANLDNNLGSGFALSSNDRIDIMYQS